MIVITNYKEETYSSPVQSYFQPNRETLWLTFELPGITNTFELLVAGVIDWQIQKMIGCIFTPPQQIITFSCYAFTSRYDELFQSLFATILDKDILASVLSSNKDKRGDETPQNHHELFSLLNAAFHLKTNISGVINLEIDICEKSWVQFKLNGEPVGIIISTY